MFLSLVKRELLCTAECIEVILIFGHSLSITALSLTGTHVYKGDGSHSWQKCLRETDRITWHKCIRETDRTGAHACTGPLTTQKADFLNIVSF